MRKWLWIVLVLAAAAVAWFLTHRGAAAGETYRTVEVARGNVEELVSATGTLDAVTKVQVGTQVSGLVTKILADFNDHVTAGQVIAVIDTTLLASEVRAARANVARAQADRDEARRQQTRSQELFDGDLISDTDRDAAYYAAEGADASLKSAKVALERAERNLGYATIRAPISGTVIERNVDVGQTVAASFSAPQLFLIAEDLSRMQILVSVDESDIGSIREGMTARFTVQAYDNAKFTGVVRQVRLQSTISDNVVNYTVVVDVDNDDGRLLPGMTATVDFIVKTAQDVLTVANAALRLRPTEAMVAAVRDRRDKERAAANDTTSGGRPGSGGSRDSSSGMRGGGQGGWAGHGGAGTRPTLLWFLDANGEPDARPVKVGVSDGTVTEVSAPWLKEGMQVIAGVSGGTTATATSNPFESRQQQQGPFRHGPPGGF